MKRIFTTIIAALAISASIFAQDARQRLTTTIVGDVLAQMPAQNAADFSTNLKDIAASAPESVIILADMLQSAEKGANNKVEYVLSGVTNYVSVEGAQYRDAVKNGLKAAAAKASDKYNKQFIEAQLRLLSPEAEPKMEEAVLSAKETAAKIKADMKSGKRNLLCEALYLKAKSGAFTSKDVLAALKSSDRSYRTMALGYANALNDKKLNFQIAKAFGKLSDGAKEDVLNWFGDNKAADQIDFIIETLGSKKLAAKAGVMSSAIEAAGKIGGNKAADALIAQLGGKYGEAAKKAILSFPGSLNNKVAEAFKTAEGSALDNLLDIAYARQMTNCAEKFYDLAKNGNAKAAGYLKGVVTPQDASRLSTLADKAEGALAESYARAFESSLRTLAPAEMYSKAKYAMEGARNKERFFQALAKSGTDEAVADLTKAYKAGSSSALDALGAIQNVKAAETLLEAGKAGNQAALDQYVSKVKTFVSNPDKRCAAYIDALEAATGIDLKKRILKELGATPTSKAFAVAAPFLKDKDLNIAAATAVKDIAAKCIDELPYQEKVDVLNEAIATLAARNMDDDVYAIDQIKKLVNEAEAPVPVSALTAEEAAQGFEMLFDGTNLDKWTGNKEGYKIQNNTIYVSAGYGSGGNLYTIKEYRDFVYRFEFCFVRPGVNNGVGVRTPMGVDAAYEGMCEVQILDHDDPIYAGWLKAHQVHGSVYGVIPAKRIVHKPVGEWSTEEIRVQGNHITVTVNGEVIVDGDIKEACQGHNVAPDGSDHNPFTVDGKNHPGMFNETGHIGFLGHGAGVKFRNVRVLDLTPAAPAKKKGRK